MNGGICSSKGQYFQCDCIEGYHGKFCEKSACAGINPCGDGICNLNTDIDQGYRCDCELTSSYGQNCEISICENLNCGPNGSPVEKGNEFECTCLCDEGFEGHNCQMKTPTLYGKKCDENEDCTSEGQICNAQEQCACNREIGYFLDGWQSSEFYGSCIGTLAFCEVNFDCPPAQSCQSHRCSCENPELEMVKIDGEFKCLPDPLPDCKEGILPNGDYGCCSQIENWTQNQYVEDLNRCVSDRNTICDSDANSKPVCGYYGDCEPIGLSSFSCKCHDNWRGTYCDQFDPCDPSPCLNGAQCSPDGNHFRYKKLTNILISTMETFFKII